MSPPHFDCFPLTLGLDEGWDLGFALDEVDGLGCLLGLGLAVLVTVLVGARVTSNCTSVGVEPSAAAYTW